MSDAVGGSWAGDLTCSSCRRKRLTAEHFSRKQLDKLRAAKGGDVPVKCRECVEKEAAAEREKATAASASGGQTGDGSLLRCSRCKTDLPVSSYTNTQARNLDSARKCKGCTAAAEVEETKQVDAARRERLTAAQQESAAAAALPKGAAGAGLAQLQAAASECAAEAELVTGLKPIKGAGMRRGRKGTGPPGGGSWRGGRGAGAGARGGRGGRGGRVGGGAGAAAGDSKGSG